MIGQDIETLLALLAYCAARTIDAVQRSWERNSRGAHHTGELALTVGLDMAEWWAPSVRATSPTCRRRGSSRPYARASRKEAGTLAGLKKDPMIEHAERLLSDKRWVPAMLRNGNAAASEPVSA